MKNKVHSYSTLLLFYFLFVVLSLLWPNTFIAMATDITSPIQETNNLLAPPVAKKEIFSAETDSPSPMTEKHIFSPEPDSVKVQDGGSLSDVNKSVAQQDTDTMLKKVKRDMDLTGIIITPESKRAMILYKGKGDKKQTPEVYTSGASISDYILKDVAPNYVVIAQNNLEVKLGLFQERNNRPEMPKEIEPQSNSNKASATDGQIPQKNMGTENNPQNVGDPDTALKDGNLPNNRFNPVSENMQENNAPDVSNPFVEALQQGQLIPSDQSEESRANSNNNTDANSNLGINPFLQAIKRARERQQSQ